MNKEHILQYLRALSPAELSELLYDVWNDWPRQPEDYYEQERHMPTGESRFVIAEVNYFDGWLEHDTSPQHGVSFVARPPQGYPIPPEERKELLQSGTCQQCRARLTCWSKDAICPVCGASAYLT